VDGREVDPASWNDRYAYRNEDIKKYDNVIKSVVKRSSARYIPIFDQLHRQTEWKEMMWEGLHPDSDGHEKIYRIVEDEMRFI
jgi:lysophospholipase L1-like esterase